MLEAIAYLSNLLILIGVQISIYFSMVAMVLFASSVLAFGMNKVMAIILVLLYLIISPATIYLYRSDKLAAQQQKQRIPEKMLHLLELAGGWPGALLAQQRFRHKTSKKTYQAVFHLILIYHASLWISFFLLKGNLGFISFLIFLANLLAINMRYRPST